MLLGTEIGAALTALEPLGIDVIGLNCATGPAEMSEHLRHLSRHAADAAVLHAQRRAAGADGKDGAYYPLTPGASWPTRTSTFVTRVRPRAWSAAAAARRPSTSARWSSGCSGRGARDPPAAPRGRASPRSTSTCRSARTPRTSSIGERTNANGSKAFREAMLEERWDDCVEIARDQIRDGAHLLDVCVDYVGRDGVADMQRDRRPVRHRVHAAARARLDRAGGHRGRAGAARRPGGRQLGQLRGRRRPRLAVRADHAAGARARRRRRRADASTRRARPAPPSGRSGSPTG